MHDVPGLIPKEYVKQDEILSLVAAQGEPQDIYGSDDLLIRML